jgi:hypothetical protein
METQVPANLSEVEDLAALLAELEAEFDRKYDVEEGMRPPLGELQEIASVIKAVKAEQTTRDEAQAQEQAELDRLHAEVRGGPDDEQGDPDPAAGDPADADAIDEVQDDAADADDEPDPAKVKPELINASAKPASAAGMKRRAPAPPPTKQETLVITAAADIPGVSNGTLLQGSEGVARAMHARARGLSNHSQVMPVATVKVPIPKHLTIGEETPQIDIDRIVKRAVEEVLTASTDAKALVAAGGWCTPSEVMFDQFNVATRDGLIDLPTIGINRGGLQIPSFLNIAAAAGALWTWTEDDDEEALVALSITNVALTSNVATITTSAAHNLAVGQTVRVNASNDTFDGVYTVASVPTSTTFTYARTAANVASAAATGSANLIKGCLRVPCPTWTDYRLEAEGLCVTAGNLQDRSFGESSTSFADLVMTAHLHKLSNAKIAKIVAMAVAVTGTTAPSDAAGDILNQIDLQVADYRSQYLLGENVVLEAAMPQHWKEQVRASLAMRAGVQAWDISNEEVVRFFTMRNVRPQFLAGYQPLFNGTPRSTWPTTGKFLLWISGAIVEGNGGEINLGVQRDSTLNETNDFTLAWSEQFYQVMRRGPQPREVTVATVTTGRTGGPQFLGA